LSLLGVGSSADTAGSDPDPEPEPDPTEAEDRETETDEAEAENEAIHSGELAADPRRDPAENDTVADRAVDPDGHAA
jgi:hypothetical protein